MNKSQWIFAFLTIFSNNSQASILTIESAGLWTVQGLPEIKITAEIDANAIDLMPDNSNFGKYTVTNLIININTPLYTSINFNDVTLMADESNSFLEVYDGGIKFFGLFKAGFNQLSHDTALDYQFLFGSDDIKTEALIDLIGIKITNPYGKSTGYIATPIGAYSSEIWDSITAVSLAGVAVPIPSAAWLFGASLAGVRLFSRRKPM